MEQEHRKPLFRKGYFPNRGFWFYWGAGVAVQVAFGFAIATVLTILILPFALLAGVQYDLLSFLMSGLSTSVGGTGAMLYDYLRMSGTPVSRALNDEKVWSAIALLQTSLLALPFAWICLRSTAIPKRLLLYLLAFLILNAAFGVFLFLTGSLNSMLL